MRGLFPRHLRAANASFFVHAPIRPQTSPVQAGKGKKSVKKIVQNCAKLCTIVQLKERKKSRSIDRNDQRDWITCMLPEPEACL
ncbi:hypothetical protein C4784_28385 [Salmonella enterica subsp. enterica serovar Gaminara]|uniref:Uncharacterized protein n=1 Tax=Salmonella enterica subsp. enterica serovar Gaminara TaxID=913070 RepID=A0A7Z1QIM5_SALET|nr:hypothetical protein C4784_28385 [Salmonella enterica subsp. enterica serovar Gaminara]